MTDTFNWVVGAGGLLGTSVCDELPRTERLWSPKESLPWHSPPELASRLALGVQEFAEATEASAWRLWWCAGKGTVSSERDVLDNELSAVSSLMGELRRAPRSWLERGQFLFSSSAGSIYAGVDGPVVGVDDPPAPLTDYGRMKLQAEEVVRELGLETRMSTIIARITNLFGPKQDMSKSQGLISTVCSSVIRKNPVPIFVSLGTVRNYINARDAARLMWMLAINGTHGAQETRIICSPANLSVGNVLKVVEDVVGDRVLTRIASRPDSAQLSRSVFFDPALVGAELDDYMPIHEGVDQVYRGLLTSWQQGLMASTMRVA